MSIDFSLLDKLVNRLEKAPDGKWYARTYSGPTVLYEDEVLGFSGGPVPGELQDVFAAQRTAVVLGGRQVASSVNPLTGGIDFSGMLMGSLADSVWFNPPSIFRLLLNGTGTVTLDSKDAAGTITTSVFSVTLTGAVNQIEFPYAGDGAIQIRAALTGTATAQVI